MSDLQKILFTSKPVKKTYYRLTGKLNFEKNNEKPKKREIENIFLKKKQLFREKNQTVTKTDFSKISKNINTKSCFYVPVNIKKKFQTIFGSFTGKDIPIVLCYVCVITSFMSDAKLLHL